MKHYATKTPEKAKVKAKYRAKLRHEGYKFQYIPMF